MAMSITQRQVRAAYAELLAERRLETFVEPLMTLYDSDQASEEYAVLGSPPPMSKWEGERKLATLSESTFTIQNLPYATGLEIPARLWRDGKMQHIDRYLQVLAARYRTHWGKLFIENLEAGETATAYDGVSFFGAHTGGDNDVGSTITDADAPTALEFTTAMNDAIQTILGFTDDQGEPMNDDASDFLVLVPNTMRTVAGTAIGSEMLASGNTAVTNPKVSYNGVGIRLASTPRLSWTTKFAVFRTDSAMKPFIGQEKSNVPGGLSIIGPASEHEFFKRSYAVGIDAERGMGYDAWQTALLHTFAE